MPVDAYGRVHPDALREAIARDPAERPRDRHVGQQRDRENQPVRELADVAAEFAIPLHADAVQAVGQLDVDFTASGLSAMTVSGHKIGGPYGIGALLLGREYAPVPVLHGGGQERQVRSGTLDAPAIASFAVAGAHATAHREEFAREIGALRDTLITAVRTAVPDAVLGGDPDPAGRLPANAHFSFPGCEGDSLLLLLDAHGIECSTGSACTAGVAQPSHVVLATGTDVDLARGTLRFSLGHTSTKADIEAVAEAIGPAVERARSAGLS
nr:aminotransferase class V-fold PLP-dependent enzyme [Streptomyces himastatinicus]